MDAKAYGRLLLQLVLIPLLGLLLVALGLGYALHRVENDAAWLDHSDRVIAQGNRLIQLIVDDETGIRGYFLSHDPSFLQPYNRAEQILPRQFDLAAAMVADNPTQVANLERLRASYERWDAVTRQELPAPPPAASLAMLDRKRAMDDVRLQGARFLETENSIRRNRAFGVNRMNARARDGVFVILILVGILIVWVTWQTFARLRQLFQAQLNESARQRDAADAGAQWLNTTLRSIGDAVIACDPTGGVVFMNRIAEKVTGWPEHEAKGHLLPDVFRIFNESTHAPVENPVDKVRRTGGVVGLANHTVLMRRDGSQCAIDDSAAPIRDASGETIGIVLVFRDSTDRRSSQTALMRAEKLAAAGKLAASIAHEVNNPLEGITNMLFLASESTDPAEVRQWLSQAQAEVKRLSHITRRTLGFYRESTQPIAYRPSDVVEEILSFYIPEAMSKKVELQSQIRTRQQTYGVPGELRQVLSNLIANSLDAMPTGGIVRLTVRDATDLLDSNRPGLRITVVDTGSGIPPEVLDHVFDPFFTTKVETGTGLGLWVSKELVEKEGGRLRVRSSIKGPLTGTAFSIFVPLHFADDIVNGHGTVASADAAGVA